jgi:hypothetical protein
MDMDGGGFSEETVYGGKIQERAPALEGRSVRK